jgi:hypothetical protein
MDGFVEKRYIYIYSKKYLCFFVVHTTFPSRVLFFFVVHSKKKNSRIPVVKVSGANNGMGMCRVKKKKGAEIRKTDLFPVGARAKICIHVCPVLGVLG